MSIRPYTCPIPRRRDRLGNPIPRLHVFSRPLITTDPEALVQAVERLVTDQPGPTSEYAWLKAQAALGAGRNYEALRQSLLEELDQERRRAESQIAKEEAELARLTEAEHEALPRLAALALPLGMGLHLEDAELCFSPDEPIPIQALAGQQGLPDVSGGDVRGQRYRLLASLGGGAVLGVSLGLLTGKLELASLDGEWGALILWASIGITVMTLIGAVLTALGQALGSAFYLAVKAKPALRGLRFWCLGVVTLVLAVALVLVESKVEQLGLFRGLVEETSLNTLRLSRTDLFFVSLMLALPSIGAYLAIAFGAGERREALADLKGLQWVRRQRIRETPAFREAAAVHQTLRGIRAEIERTRGRLDQLNQARQEGLGERELYRLEDVESEVAAHSWAAEEAYLVASDALRKPFRNLSIFRWFFRRFAGTSRAGRLALNQWEQR